MSDSDCDSSGTESDNSDSCGDLRYKRAKNGKISYWCRYCGHENINDVDKHFVKLEKTNAHFSYGLCKDEIDDERSYKILLMTNHLM